MNSWDNIFLHRRPQKRRPFRNFSIFRRILRIGSIESEKGGDYVETFFIQYTAL